MLTFLKIGKAVNGLEDTLRHTFGDHKDFNKLLVAERELIFRRPEPLNHWKKRRSTLQGKIRRTIADAEQNLATVHVDFTKLMVVEEKIAYLRRQAGEKSDEIQEINETLRILERMKKTPGARLGSLFALAAPPPPPAPSQV